MPTIIEFSSKLSTNNAVKLFASDDFTAPDGKYVPLAEYEALNEKRLEIGRSYSDMMETLEMTLQASTGLALQLDTLRANAEHDKEAMRQAADKIAELQREIQSTKDFAAYQGKTINELSTELNRLKVEYSEVLKARSIQVTPPDTIPQRLAIAKLQQMTPQEVTVWLGEVYERVQG